MNAQGELQMKQGHINHHVSALDPLHGISPWGRHRPRDRAGRGQHPRWGAHPRRLAVRNAGARRAAVGARHHPPRVARWGGRPCHPHDGSRTCWRQDRQLQRSLFLGLDAHRARRDRDLLRHPLGARTVEPAKGSVPVVQQREFPKVSEERNQPCCCRYTSSRVLWP